MRLAKDGRGGKDQEEIEETVWIEEEGWVLLEVAPFPK